MSKCYCTHTPCDCVPFPVKDFPIEGMSITKEQARDAVRAVQANSSGGGVLAVMHDSALRLRTKGCTEFARDLDEARAIVQKLIDRLEGIGNFLSGKGPNAETAAYELRNAIDEFRKD